MPDHAQQPPGTDLAAPGVSLRAVRPTDLAIFFEQQQDPEANWMAAFTVKDPQDRAAYLARWTRIIDDPTITMRTIVTDGDVAGSIVCFEEDGERSVSYWIGREFWGRGVATQALAEFLDQVTVRPLFARVAKDNLASRRVLAKCGFVICGEDKGYANARRAEIEEFILRLE